MEIFMRNIPYTADEVKVTYSLQHVLHTSQFQRHVLSPGLPMNFKILLFKNRRAHHGGHGHSGCGSLTLPSELVGRVFLEEFGGRFPRRPIRVDDRAIIFERSKHQPRSDILGEIQLLPYRDPQAIRAKEIRQGNLGGDIRLQDVQFAWYCRDGALSVEWQWDPPEEISGASPHLRFNDESREIIVEMRTDKSHTTRIATRYTRVQSIETDSSPEPTIVLRLETPPSFEIESEPTVTFASIFDLQNPVVTKRIKLTHLNEEHASVVPFTWETLRLTCRSLSDLSDFKFKADIANLFVKDHHYQTVRRELFSPSVLRQINQWLRSLEWSVGFQCETLRRDLLLDTRELLDLRSSIDDLIITRGSNHTTEVLRQFGLHLRNIWVNQEEESVRSCFDRARDAVQQAGPSPIAIASNGRTFQCLHVNFTPTTMRLRGPFPDTSNRILRRYPDHHGFFLRVSFTDEEGLKFRFDHREVDGPQFIQERVGKILKNGFELCGRKYEFLAYSQSALKQYTVWFVTRFSTGRGRYVDAASIRASIGSAWPEDVRRCPARYAARLSQAFTATEPSIFVEPDHVTRLDDIERNNYCFSDGNGPLSQEMADAIHEALQLGSVRANRSRRAPSVFQVRIQGAKGVLSIDSTLSGLSIGLRPSMVKFEASGDYEIEVARSFNRPSKMFLNRPLVMILDGLGVKAEVFQQMQKDAVNETMESSKTLRNAARLLEMHGLGTAFALPSTLINLRKLGLEWKGTEGGSSSSRVSDAFAERAMEYAVNHVLREMKHRARIPVPQSWKLVGVVDVHNILKPNQIYACLVQGEGAKPEYMKDPILISKSPTIHPGDVQMAEAIGAPPRDSPLMALSNCVVFSQRGDRPLPNMLSGSDLDGDEYDLIPLRSLHPPELSESGSYAPAPKRRLPRDSTIHDVADFFVDFINNDTLGLIATNFLLIADRKTIFDPACLTLAELHSWAVDFSKSGEPVPLQKIPQPNIRVRPDWHAPEIINPTSSADFYESQSVLGKLFRDIDLPGLSASGHDSRAQQRRKRQGQKLSLEDAMDRLSLESGSFDDPISINLRRRLRSLVALAPTEKMTGAMIRLFDHFAAELERICFSYTLSRRADARLTEEEVFMGTIIAKSSQPRMRRDQISAMREETTALVRSMRKEIEGGEDASLKDWVNRAWAAWKVSIVKDGLFASKSFGWIALRGLFDCIKYLDEEN